MHQKHLLPRIFHFYRDGFRAMTLGRTLWKIILLKLFIMFGVLKLFFFHDFLATRFTTDQERADYVLTQLTAGAPRPSRTGQCNCFQRRLLRPPGSPAESTWETSQKEVADYD